MRRLPEKVQRRLLRLLEDLEDGPWPDNVDVTALTALRPWLRVRDGNYRIFLREMTDDEMTTLGIELPQVGFFVGRIVDKKDVKQAMKNLR